MLLKIWSGNNLDTLIHLLCSTKADSSAPGCNLHCKPISGRICSDCNACALIADEYTAWSAKKNHVLQTQFKHCTSIVSEIMIKRSARILPASINMETNWTELTQKTPRFGGKILTRNPIPAFYTTHFFLSINIRCAPNIRNTCGPDEVPDFQTSS